MSHRFVRITACLATVLLSLTGCQMFGSAEPAPEPTADSAEPPPVASAGLRAHPLPPPRPTAEQAADIAPAPRVRAPGLDSPAAVRADILIVNDMTLTVDEILFALRDELPAGGDARSRDSANALAERIAARVQFEVGSLLLYQEASGGLSSQQMTVLEQTAKRAFDDEVNRSYGGSVARCEEDLHEHGLTLADYRARLARQMLVRSYTREKIRPQVSLRRSELLAYYEANRDTFSDPETRELLMIEAPYAAFLPDGVRWETAGSTRQAKAKLAARRHIRKAREALHGRDFRSVAAEYSKAPQASEGGSWGMLGKPLRAPFAEISAWAFSHGSNQPSDPIEIDRGWYIACCGRINPRRDYSFSQAQEKIREAIVNERADLLAGEYVRKLAAKATISDLGSFMRQAIERGLGV